MNLGNTIYLDYHATTPVAPEVLEAMLPFFSDRFANPSSTTHQPGRDAAEVVDRHIANMADLIGADASEIVITSGATESNNLALLGYCLHPRQRRRKIVSVATEHPAVLDPLKRLQRLGFQVVFVPVQQRGEEVPGQIRIDSALEAIDETTAIVSVMLANNEIGVIQPLHEIADKCRELDVCLHTDAAQAVGRVPIDVDTLGVDLMSFSAHKMYGPKGSGALFVRRRGRRVRLQPQILGGGHQSNLRSGTLNVPGIVGMASAMQWTISRMDEENARQAALRQLLWELLCDSLDFLQLNGPPLDWAPDKPPRRLPNNLNCCFYPLEGQSIMLEAPQLAVSSGSACSSAHPEPSHVLREIGLSEDEARSSLRFGLGYPTTRNDVERAAEMIIDAVNRLAKHVS